MKKRKAGRPVSKYSISKTGTSHTFLLSEVDEKTAQRLMDYHRMGFTDLMRFLIRQEAQRTAHNGDVVTDETSQVDEPTPPLVDTLSTHAG